DLCCRLRASGERVGYCGSVSARQYEGTTFDHVGHDKLPIWERHVRVLRQRWLKGFAAGPCHDSAELAWRPIHKDYANPQRPVVRVLSPDEVPTERESY